MDYIGQAGHLLDGLNKTNIEKFMYLLFDLHLEL